MNTFSKCSSKKLCSYRQIISSFNHRNSKFTQPLSTKVSVLKHSK